MAKEPMSDFDHLARSAMRKLDSAGLLRWLLGEKFWSAWRWLGWEDSQPAPDPGKPGLRADTVAIFDRPKGDYPPLLAVFEFLAEARRDVLERLAGYSLHFGENVVYQSGPPRVPYQVITIVVNLKGTLDTGEWSMAPPDCGDFCLWLSAGVRNLEGREARATLTGIEAGTISRSVLIFVPLMAGAAGEDVVVWWRRLAEQEPNEEMRADFG